jgi:hypothetical protein
MCVCEYHRLCKKNKSDALSPVKEIMHSCQKRLDISSADDAGDGDRGIVQPLGFCNVALS